MNYREIEEYDPEERRPRVNLIRDHLVRGEIVLAYTLVDEFLNAILCNHFGRKRSHIKLWRTKRFKNWLWAGSSTAATTLLPPAHQQLMPFLCLRIPGVLDFQPAVPVVRVNPQPPLCHDPLQVPPISLPAGKTARASNVGGGDFQLRSLLIPDMRMGKEELGPQTGFVVAGQRDEEQNFDGLLSMRGLHLEEIGFDFENRRISWKK